jgi:uncharacterized protein YndB with AHSA1/START domain
MTPLQASSTRCLRSVPPSKLAPDGKTSPIAAQGRIPFVAHYTIQTLVNAPPDEVFALWTDVERMGEWVGGVTGVTDLSGPIDRVGSRYVVHFGPVRSPTEVIDVERPRRFATRFGSWVLRGTSSATFEPDGDGTRIVQEFQTVGRMSAISAWIFSRGTYQGSFRGELEKFARLAEREAAIGRTGSAKR